MPLIACPDCQRQVSDSAPACPNCGRAISPASAKTETFLNRNRGCADLLIWPIIFVIVAVLLLGVIR